MKNKKLVTVLLLLFFASAYSQLKDNKKNIVKTNLTGYLFRNYNLTYERSLTSWFSIAVSYGKIPEGEVPLLNQFLKEDDIDFGFKDVQLSNTQITIEPRFYLSKGYGHGFYFAPYYRQSKIQLNNIIYNTNLGISAADTSLSVAGNITGTSYGFMLGSQWFIGKKNNWVIDWWILGGHYGTSESSLEAISSRILTPQEQVELKKSLEDIDLSVAKFKTTTTTTNDRGAKMVLTGPWAGLRAGLSFGYRF
jgi:hypothetical protein